MRRTIEVKDTKTGRWVRRTIDVTDAGGSMAKNKDTGRKAPKKRLDRAALMRAARSIVPALGGAAATGAAEAIARALNVDGRLASETGRVAARAALSMAIAGAGLMLYARSAGQRKAIDVAGPVLIGSAMTSLGPPIGRYIVDGIRGAVEKVLPSPGGLRAGRLPGGLTAGALAGGVAPMLVAPGGMFADARGATPSSVRIASRRRF